MNDLVPRRLVEHLEMWDFQIPDGLDGGGQRGVGPARAAAGPKLASRRPQRPQDLGPVEPLTRAVLAKIHGSFRLQMSSVLLSE